AARRRTAASAVEQRARSGAERAGGHSPGRAARAAATSTAAEVERGSARDRQIAFRALSVDHGGADAGEQVARAASGRRRGRRSIRDRSEALRPAGGTNTG